MSSISHFFPAIWPPQPLYFLAELPDSFVQLGLLPSTCSSPQFKYSRLAHHHFGNPRPVRKFFKGP